MIIPITCKHCGFENLKVTSHPKTLDDLNDAVRSNCGAAISKNDLRLQTQKLSNEAVRDSVREKRRKPLH